ncbi:tetratricopeptide repeat protein [Alteraurantiacibacter palmitatis]|uniref:Tetratricopeptide repeat protein n=1 Tax=Alteraurantiacibacter palmitatis TaxID=2054628 RepID=A0ABV7EBB2_9SPHN
MAKGADAHGIQTSWRKGALLALAATALLAGAATWRLMEQTDSAPPPAASQPADQPQSLDELRRQAESSADDPVAWQRLAFASFNQNLFAEAAAAYEKAVALEPESAVLWSALGEARVMASARDPMPPAALEAFRRAVAIDPGDARARYFLATAKDLAGDNRGAIADWLALLADTPPGAPWETDLVRTINQVAQRDGIALGNRVEQALAARGTLPLPVSPAGIPGPTQEQLAAATALPPSEQQEMAEGMVARLAARLEREPANVDGWIMLMRSYRHLGRDAEARQAYDRAVAANPAATRQLREAASALGVPLAG